MQRYAWTARQSHIYPELGKLAAEGLIEVAEEGARGRRTYALTDAGRSELRAWLLSPGKPRAIRDEQALRMCLLSALEPAEATEKVREYLAEAERAIAEMREIAQAADAAPHPRGKLRMGRLALEYGIFQYEAQRKWAEWALAELSA